MADIYQRFESITEFSDYMSKHNTPTRGKEEISHGTSEARAKFTGTANYEEANNYLLYGCSSLANEIEDMGVRATRVKLQKQKNKNRMFTSIVGFAPHVPNYIAGVPNSMINQKTVKVPQKVVTIAYNTAIVWKEKAEDIKQAAANFLSSILMIEAGGVRVNVDLYFTCSGKEGETICLCIKIKESSQAFDLLKMVYPMVHPSMLRRHIFRYMECNPKISKYCSDRGGLMHPYTDWCERLARKHDCKYDLMVGYYDIKRMNSDDVLGFIKRKLEEKK